MIDAPCVSSEARELAASLLKMTGDCAVSRLLCECFVERPQLMPVLRDMGGWSLEEYGSHLVSNEGSISDTLRAILTELAMSRYGSIAADHLRTLLTTLNSIDTAGHGGVLSEDTLVQGHLIASYGGASKGQSGYISLACGVVPMNNSTWPRGFYVQGKRESIFPKSFDKVAYHECRGFSKEQIEKGIKESPLHSGKHLIFETIDGIDHIYEQESFPAQVSMINRALWKRAFTHLPHQSELFSFMLEEVTAKLVLHSIENNGILAQMILNRELRDEVLECFNGLPGSWAHDTKRGTDFFWRRSGDFREASLWCEGERFIPHGAEPFAIDADILCDKLRSGEIVPGVFLSLLSLLVNGARCLGGYHQIWYLPEYRTRLSRLAEQGTSAGSTFAMTLLPLLSRVLAVNMSYGPVFALDDQEPGPASIDLYLRRPELAAEIPQLLRTTTVVKGCALNLKRWYGEIVPKEKREATLNSLTQKGICSDVLKAFV